MPGHAIATIIDAILNVHINNLILRLAVVELRGCVQQFARRARVFACMESHPFGMHALNMRLATR
jgi:hypothetical protein